jgi:hypothetical protein
MRRILDSAMPQFLEDIQTGRIRATARLEEREKMDNLPAICAKDVLERVTVSRPDASEPNTVVVWSGQAMCSHGHTPGSFGGGSSHIPIT